MKDLYNRIASGDVPIEWAFGIVAGGGILILICWHMLTKDDKPAQPTVRRGFIPILLGLAGIIYFMAFFSVGVSDGHGRTIANYDLMNQRQSGVIVSAAVLICGVILSSTDRRRERADDKNPFEK